MKSFFLQFLTALSLLGSAHAVLSSSPSSRSCGAPNVDDSYFSVVGVQGTGVHPRQDLRELEKDTETWNMFIQALARFQAMNQNDKLSYYKIAGIHGVPFGQWDGVSAQEGQNMMGYCPHTSSLFGTWHRPYLALFEQILHDRAVDIANEYAPGTARERALEISNKVRLPYWDWAVNPAEGDGVMPSSLRRPKITVFCPNGTRSEIKNPLYRYDFHPLKYDDFSILSEFEFKEWNHTIRYPLDGFAANATSRNDEVNARIGKQQPNLRDMLYKLLTTYQPFNQVSNKANGGTIGNFETLHDGLHNVFGLGHMGIVEVSAYDPIFWLHHCNMDRIIALYQYRYPDTWVEDAAQAMGTFTISKGAIQGADAPLTPFHMNADGDMWTSTFSRNWTSFGYTYPELMHSPSNATFTSTLNKLYKPQTPGLPDNATTTFPSPGNNTTNTTTSATDWLCEVHMPTDIKISYSVRAFLGPPPTDPKIWPTAPNYIGQLASMSSSRMSSDVIVSGTISLTDTLAQKYREGELKSLAKPDVAAYLKEQFHWRIQALDFSEIPRSEKPKGLEVSVYHVAVELPRSEEEVPTRKGEREVDEAIDGNPELPGQDGKVVQGAHGVWNGTSGEFEWRNGTNTESTMMSRTTLASRTSSSVLSSVAPLSSTGGLQPSPSSTITSVVSAETPATTKPAGPETRYVTEIVYVTL